VPDKLPVSAIQALGFEWPKYDLVDRYSVVEDGLVDLARTLEAMRSSRSFYCQQINDAYRFKQQTGADYSDFTDRFDEYTRMERGLSRAIAYVTEILARADA
jgi:hypothetical protein